MYRTNVSSDFVGIEMVRAWARILEGVIIDGVGDGGKDIRFWHNGYRWLIQVKGTVQGVIDHLAAGVRHHRVIPWVMGDPGAAVKADVVAALQAQGYCYGKNAIVANWEKNNISQYMGRCWSHGLITVPGK